MNMWESLAGQFAVHWQLLLISSGAIFLAAIVRGFSGFFLLLGYVIALPFGVYALANVPAPPMQIALGLFVIVTGIMMLNGFGLDNTPGAAATVATGAGSGILNGAFGMGGPPVDLFYFSTPAARCRPRLGHRLLPFDRQPGFGRAGAQRIGHDAEPRPVHRLAAGTSDRRRRRRQGVQAHGSGEIPPCRAGHPDRPRRPYIGESRLRPQRLTDRQWSTMGTVAKLKREMVANA